MPSLCISQNYSFTHMSDNVAEQVPTVSFLTPLSAFHVVASPIVFDWFVDQMIS